MNRWYEFLQSLFYYFWKQYGNSTAKGMMYMTCCVYGPCERETSFFWSAWKDHGHKSLALEGVNSLVFNILLAPINLRHTYRSRWYGVGESQQTSCTFQATTRFLSLSTGLENCLKMPLDSLNRRQNLVGNNSLFPRLDESVHTSFALVNCVVLSQTYICHWTHIAPIVTIV